MRILIPLLALAASLAAQPALGTDYTITGHIQTRSGSAAGSDLPVYGIRVELYQIHWYGDECVGTVYTNPQGLFVVQFGSLLGPHLYLAVTYEFDIFDGKRCYVRDAGSGNTLAEDHIANQAGVRLWEDPDPATDLGTFDLATNKANIGTHVAKTVAWVRTIDGWPAPADLVAYAVGAGSICRCCGTYIEIPPECYDDPQLPGYSFSDIHHETGHWIQFKVYGDHWPQTAYPGATHWYNSEKDEGFAVCEGWAEYIACITATPDWRNDLTRFTSPDRWWRGPIGTGTNNSGEIVEGALWRIWNQINDFPMTFWALQVGKPDSFKQWLDQYGMLYGWEPAGVALVFEASAANGIVFTRAGICDFLETAPPNQAPPDAGNCRVLGNGNVTFLRGRVTPLVARNSATELNLAAGSATIDVKALKFGYKVANAGLGEPFSGAAWQFLPPLLWTDDRFLDTKAIGDGEFDLIVHTQNIYEWWDLFLPSFTGDSDATRDSDEKWLKHLRAWYNQDTDPNNDDEGKVVIDNTPPQISKRKPQ